MHRVFRRGGFLHHTTNLIMMCDHCLLRSQQQKSNLTGPSKYNFFSAKKSLFHSSFKWKFASLWRTVTGGFFCRRSRTALNTAETWCTSEGLSDTFSDCFLKEKKPSFEGTRAVGTRTKVGNQWQIFGSHFWHQIDICFPFGKYHHLIKRNLGFGEKPKMAIH
jgi:hypothetical protein